MSNKPQLTAAQQTVVSKVKRLSNISFKICKQEETHYDMFLASSSWGECQIRISRSGEVLLKGDENSLFAGYVEDLLLNGSQK